MTNHTPSDVGRMIAVHVVPLDGEDRSSAERTHRQLLEQSARLATDTSRASSPAPDSRSEELEAPSERCSSYNVGHMVHFIQARKSWMDKRPGQREVPVQLLAVSDDGWLDLQVDGSDVVRRWTHDAHRARRLLRRRRTGQRITGKVNLRWWYLDLDGDRPFSITETPSPCVFDPPTGDLVRDLETHGGFLVTGPQALEQLDRHES